MPNSSHRLTTRSIQAANVAGCRRLSVTAENERNSPSASAASAGSAAAFAPSISVDKRRRIVWRPEPSFHLLNTRIVASMPFGVRREVRVGRNWFKRSNVRRVSKSQSSSSFRSKLNIARATDVLEKGVRAVHSVRIPAAASVSRNMADCSSPPRMAITISSGETPSSINAFTRSAIARASPVGPAVSTISNPPAVASRGGASRIVEQVLRDVPKSRGCVVHPIFRRGEPGRRGLAGPVDLLECGGGFGEQIAPHAGIFQRQRDQHALGKLQQVLDNLVLGLREVRKAVDYHQRQLGKGAALTVAQRGGGPTRTSLRRRTSRDR